MEQMQHQMMGYDRTSIMFSPDGRLLQVEYAKKTVKQGTTAMGMVCKDGVLLLADKRISEPLIIAGSIEKVSPIDDHIGATASGIVSDGRVLIDIGSVVAHIFDPEARDYYALEDFWRQAKRVRFSLK